MSYHDGHLRVTQNGLYYIYLQVACKSKGIVKVYLNDDQITLVEKPTESSTGTLYTGGVFRLLDGYKISIKSGSNSLILNMQSGKSYFGAYLI